MQPGEDNADIANTADIAVTAESAEKRSTAMVPEDVDLEGKSANGPISPGGLHPRTSGDLQRASFQA